MKLDKLLDTILLDAMPLDRCELGSYVLMLCYYWKHKGPIPDDDQGLRNIAKCDVATWARCKGALRPLFDVKAGHWRHSRLDTAIAEAKAQADTFTERAKVAAKARYKEG